MINNNGGGNPNHDENGRFTSSNQKVINQMGLSDKDLDKEDTDKKIAQDFVYHLNKGGKINFAGNEISLENIDKFTELKDASLEEKMLDIVSRATNYK